ncbi:MAG: sulfatase-like hydrolase/transferase [bacterium]
MRRHARGLLAATLVGIAVPACDRAPSSIPSTPAVDPPPRDVASLLFVSLDTFRADAAGCGGHPRAHTPHLDRLARQGAQLDGIAATPLTAPSHTSMMTGLDPPAHGVRDNGTFRLDDSVPTLAEALSARGFETAAFVAAFPVSARFGLARGFDRYDEALDGSASSFAIAQRPGTEVAAAARPFWRDAAGSRRFVWVHLFDAHTPHDAPRSLIRALGDDYLADVSVADRALGRVLADAEELAGPHWVVVLGDHGESRGDHKEATHGLFVYRATMAVPAIVWPRPKEIAAVSRRPFRLIDLPATAFALLGLEPSAAPGQGLSVLGKKSAAAYLESHYAYYHYGWAPLAALQDGDWKYVDAPEPELYDLAADPGETDDLAGIEADRARELALRLASRTEEDREGPRSDLAEADREALESLGYVTGAEDRRSDLPDPKRMVRVVNALEQAQAAIGAGQLDVGLRLLRRAQALDPRNKDVQQTFGITYSALGDHEAAAESFRRALELPPHHNDRVPRFELASSLLRLGRPEEAAGELERLLAAEPDDADAWYNLGVARQALGRPQRAQEAFRRALAVDPDHELARAQVRPD